MTTPKKIIIGAVPASEQSWSNEVFARTLEVNGLPRKIFIDKSGANTASLRAINKMLKG
ncbi:hypothetical protein RUE5091_04203 [Ruegeria denitrificans]|uniref:Uncharacterized protein n=1 Tax=Ruegeria denitrificans TaxID=1715692 RepID=A0A0P1IQE5_9RHOB|nr:hypothetical protein RUE5091_04203 [Ruegeria denitrificans]